MKRPGFIRIIFRFFFFLLFISSLYSQSGWFSIPSGTSSWLQDIQVVNENAVYVAGFGYTILKSTNLGSSWVIQYSGANYYNFRSISFINEITGYAAGGTECPPPFQNYSVVYKTVNGGNLWNQVHSSGGYPNHLIYAVDSLKAFKSSRLYYESIGMTTNGGFNWSSIQGIAGISIHFINMLTGFALGQTMVSKTTNGGFNWVNYSLSLPAQSIPNKICFSNQNTGYIVFTGYSNGYVIKTTNSGVNWLSPIALPDVTETFSIYCISSDTLFVTGRRDLAHYGRILRSTDGGQNWIIQYYGGGYTIPYSISFLNSQTGFAVGPTGLILKTVTGGEVGITPISGEVPKIYSLSQNYPNPFNPSTTIEFDLPKDANIMITLYDVMGREVQTLASEFRKAGSYKLDFDGSVLSSGTYFYRLQAGEFVETKKMILIK